MKKELLRKLIIKYNTHSFVDITNENEIQLEFNSYKELEEKYKELTNAHYAYNIRIQGIKVITRAKEEYIEVRTIYIIDFEDLKKVKKWCKFDDKSDDKMLEKKYKEIF